jgi:hypothetical protein
MSDRTSARIAVGLLGSLCLVAIVHIIGLQADVVDLQEKLADREVCPDVHVTCNCPEYEEGWDDAEFAEGCTADSFTYSELETMCADLMYAEPEGIPGC